MGLWGREWPKGGTLDLRRANRVDSCAQGSHDQRTQKCVSPGHSPYPRSIHELTITSEEQCALTRKTNEKIWTIRAVHQGIQMNDEENGLNV